MCAVFYCFIQTSKCNLFVNWSAFEFKDQSVSHPIQQKHLYENQNIFINISSLSIYLLTQTARPDDNQRGLRTGSFDEATTYLSCRLWSFQRAPSNQFQLVRLEASALDECALGVGNISSGAQNQQCTCARRLISADLPHALEVVIMRTIKNISQSPFVWTQHRREAVRNWQHPWYRDYGKRGTNSVLNSL